MKGLSKAEEVIGTMFYWMAAKTRKEKEAGTTVKITMEDETIIELKKIKAINTSKLYTDFLQFKNNDNVLKMRIRHGEYKHFLCESPKDTP